MDDRLRKLQRAGLSDPEAKDRYIAALERLAGGYERAFFIVRCLGRTVHEWTEDGQGDYIHDTSFDAPDGQYDSFEAISKNLDMFGLPPIQQWEPNPDEPGMFYTAIIEDDNGHADEDGNYIVDYTIRIDRVASVPVQAEDLPELKLD